MTSQIILILLGLFYLNNTSTYSYLKESDELTDAFFAGEINNTPKLLQPKMNTVTVDNVKQILQVSYQLKNTIETMGQMKLGEGNNYPNRSDFEDILYGIHPYMNNNEKERYSKINTIISNVDKATKSISRINNMNAEFSNAQNITERANLLYETLAPLIDSQQLKKAKNIADMLRLINNKNMEFTNNADENNQSDEDDQKQQIIDIIESFEKNKQ
jgi:hypothetical protein